MTALVLFSGGQDSATCLAWALEHFDRVETVGFNYGQQHRVELECRQSVLKGMRRIRPDWPLGEDHVLKLAPIGEPEAPSTFLPGRNIIFLTFAAVLAYRRGLRHLVGGMCETDFSGYPDCRDDAIKAIQVALNLGMDRRFVLHTPLMWIDKAATWELARSLGGEALVDLILEDTNTCYLGDRSAKHSWGYGCGNCPACRLRENGHRIFREG